MALFHLSLKYRCIQQDADNRQFMRDIGMPATTDINELIGYKIQRWWPEVPLPKACKCKSECSLSLDESSSIMTQGLVTCKRSKHLCIDLTQIFVMAQLLTLL